MSRDFSVENFRKVISIVGLEESFHWHDKFGLYSDRKFERITPLVAVVFSKRFEQLVVVSTDAGAKKITNNNNNNNNQALFTVSLH